MVLGLGLRFSELRVHGVGSFCGRIKAIKGSGLRVSECGLEVRFS